jgi:tripartite-type tricarboxylate transporter receptor subunit TctC
MVAGVATPAVLSSASAQTFPARPERVVVPYAPGGNTDLYGRLIARWLAERLGQPFVIENRPGAGTNIGTEAVVRAPADGHTLLLVAPTAAINATLYEKLNFNFLRDIAPVAGLISQYLMMLVNPSLPAKTVPEFIAYAKQNPGRLSFASQGVGSPGQMAGELFKVMTGIDMVHVPYRGGGPALTDLISGQVQMMLISAAVAIEHVRSGRLRALAVTSKTRWDSAPDLPTVHETVPGYEMSSWFGIGAPKATPTDVVERLNKEINAGLEDPKVKAQIVSLDAVPLIVSSTEFGAFIAQETDKWAKVIRAAQIKPE